MAKLPDSIVTNIFSIQRQIIECTEASLDASIASLQEIQRNWN